MNDYMLHEDSMSSDGQAFARLSATGFEPMEEENVCDSIFQQYERVIVESLITSFGLDFINGTYLRQPFLRSLSSAFLGP